MGTDHDFALMIHLLEGKHEDIQIVLEIDKIKLESKYFHTYMNSNHVIFGVSGLIISHLD